MLASTLTMLILDGMWLNLFMGPRYKTMVQTIQKSPMNVNKLSALGAYLMMIYLLLNIVLKYNLTLSESFLFGCAVFGVYDFTCGAIFKNWNFNLASIDILWGGILFATCRFVAQTRR